MTDMQELCDISLRSGKPRWPAWVPEAVRHYMAHVHGGETIREVARDAGCHASTVMRQVRKIEDLRDDPLVDAAFARLAFYVPEAAVQQIKDEHMTAQQAKRQMIPDDATLEREGRRVLRRLSEPRALLVLAPEMDRAVVLCETTPGAEPVRTAVVERIIAEAMVLKEWIEAQGQSGKVLKYRITTTGRAALKRIMARNDRHQGQAGGFAEAQAPFAAQHQIWGEREDPASLFDSSSSPEPRTVRVNMAESPLTMLARRKDAEGKPFLSPELVAAGEQLREDFELAAMGPRITQNWERFLTGGDRGCFGSGSGPLRGPEAARARVSEALRDLGPGLADAALRCCCFLEGLETTERRMGWSARSGKVVLRIALQRLRQHYDQHYGKGGPLIG